MKLGISGVLTRAFIQSALTPLLLITSVIIGAIALVALPREEEPQISVPMVDIIVAANGYRAGEAIELVTRPLEDIVKGINGVEHVYSVTEDDRAVVTARFYVGTDEDTAILRVHDKISANITGLPKGIPEPLIIKRGINDVATVVLAVAADPAYAEKWTDNGLYQVAEELQHELSKVDNIGSSYIVGGAANQIRVEPDPERLSEYGITLNQVIDKLTNANRSFQVGTFRERGKSLPVLAGQTLQGVPDIGLLVLTSRDGRPVYVKDVATVVVGAAETEHRTWTLTPTAKDGATALEKRPVVEVAFAKRKGANAVVVADDILKRLETVKGRIVPPGVGVTVTRNFGETATEKADELLFHLGLATVSIVALILFTIGWREALVVAVIIPTTILLTMFASYIMGYTINRVSLFALIFSIGILVDDAIVVIENIVRHWHMRKDRGLVETAVEAVAEVGNPTIVATLTIVAALLPMMFVSGLMGPYMSPIPINASMGMFISLVVAFVVTPWLAQKMLKNVDAHQHGGEDRMTKRLDGLFRRVMTPMFDARRGGRNRLMLWLAVFALIGASVALPVVQLVVMKMLPFDNKSEFQVVLDMPVGTPLEDTARVLNEIGAHLATVPEVTDWQSYAGTAAPINFNGLVRQYYLRSAPEQGDIQVNLVDKHARDRQSHEIAVSVRDAVTAIARRNGGNAKVVEVPPGPPVLSPIVAELYGPDYDGQLAVAKQVRAAFEDTADIVGVDDTVDEDAPKLLLRVDQAKAARMGVAQADIVEVVRLGLSGENVTPVHGGDNKYEIPVRIQLPATRQSEVGNLLAMQVRARDGRRVTISELVSVAETKREQILYRKDLLPVVYVTGDMGGELDSPLYGMFDIRSRVRSMALGGAPAVGGTLGEWFINPPADPYGAYQLKWDGEWQITYETFRDMGAAYAVGLVLIYLLVVAQFRSYLVPLIIMAPIPLTIVGVMPGHALLGAQFTATSMIGMIALAGIIVRNSILLVDFVNQQLAEGMAFGEALIRAAAVRAKPIGLTALAAMIGAVFILDDPIFNGLAISLIFGIFVSTVLTLVVIPVLYYAAMRGRIARPQSSEENPA